MLRRALLALVAATLCAACSRQVDDAMPVATPTVTLSAPSAAIESPIDVTYRFAVAPDAPRLTQDFRVFVHFSDATGRQLWADDHLPSTPTTRWIPGTTIEYTRTMFVPKVPYTGEVTIDVGLYMPGSDERVPLGGTDAGRRAYRVGTLEVTPQASATRVMFGGGWHNAEIIPDSPGVEWRWSRAESALQFRNPRQDVLLLLDLDQPQPDLPNPQQVQLRIGSNVVDQFTVQPGDRLVRRAALPAAALGNSDTVDMTLAVSPTFTPAYLPGSTNKDARTLGIRVFHAYVEPTAQPK